MAIGDRQPDSFVKGQRLTASALNTVVESVLSILRKMYGTAIMQPPDIEGRLDGPLAKATNYATTPATATLSVWIKDATTGELVDSGRNETVVNRMINAGPFSANAIVYARWMNGEWRVYAADC